MVTILGVVLLVAVLVGGLYLYKTVDRFEGDTDQGNDGNVSTTTDDVG